ncbi:MAG: hypothetical protein NTY83_02690 [Candidatus Micrarchaeota archaeon]|nr:hypothetical protein [Candidatus Micrarchaeota archaeon]
MGVGLSATIVFFYIAMVMLDDSTAGSQAKDAVNRLAQEADYVYSLSPGTARHVDFTIPRGTEILEVGDHRVHMKVRLSSGLTDFYANTRPDLVGSLRVSPGPSRALVKHLESGNVLVGNKELAFTPMLLEFYLQRGESASADINVTNAGERNLTGILAYVKGLESFISISQPADRLAPWENSSISVSVALPLNASMGNYYGSVRGNTSEGSWDETAVIIAIRGGPPHSCSIFPLVWNVSIEDVANFESTCYDSGGFETSCPNLQWSSDGGVMIPQASPSGSLLYVNQIGTSVNASGGGMECSATLTYPDPYGPLVTNLTFYPPTPMNLTVGLNILVNATGDDTTTGNSNIKACRANVDWGDWFSMDPVDGTYNSSVEKVTAGIGSNYTEGWHTIFVQCQDDHNNWGPVVTAVFYLSDKRGPVVTLIYLDQYPICALETATVYARAVDYEEAVITGCEYKRDNGTWSQMEPADGGFDTDRETGMAWEELGFTSGNHRLWARCTDFFGNTGPEASQMINTSFCYPELFTDPGFEDLQASANNAKWQRWNEARPYSWSICTPDSGRTQLGTSALLLGANMHQGVSVSGSTNYTLKIWTRSSKPLTAPLRIGVQDGSYWLQRNGSWLANATYLAQNMTSSWAQKRMTFVTRSGTGSLTIYFVMDNDTGYVHIDDASLRRT